VLMRKIKGFDKYLIAEDGSIWSKHSKIFLRQRINNRGYYCVDLYFDTGRYKTKNIHRLLLESFFTQNEVKVLACHRNDDQLDNRLVNLKWGTFSDNLVDAYNNGKR